MEPVFLVYRESYRQMIATHTKIIKKVPPFTNEYNMMVHLYTGQTFVARTRDIEMWYLSLPVVNTETLELARDLRYHGNGEFAKRNRNIMAACRLYTMSIFNADYSGLQLALGHANRSMALQLVGYYQAAYDDAVCARRAGYPDKLINKVILRQANCAYHLGNIADMLKHMNEIPDEEKLTKYKAEFEDLEKKLKRLQANTKEGAGGDGHAKVVAVEPKTKVVKPTKTDQGRLVTTQDVKKFDLLYTDRAVAIVPVGYTEVCHNCIAVQHIPFPCNRCGGEVQYCSLKCREQHQSVHKYECAGFKQGFFQVLGPSFLLAFRVMVTELPQLVDLLKDVGSDPELWAELNGRGHIITADSALGRSLFATTNMHELPPHELMSFAVSAHVMLYYLQTISGIHEVFNRHSVLMRDWELILAALCMRRLYQLTHHAHAIDTLNCGLQSQDGVHNLLMPNMWKKPKHLRKGNCHLMGSSSYTALAYYPYSNSGRRSCDPNLVRHKYNGYDSCTYAWRDFKSGEEVKRFHFFSPCSKYGCPGLNQQILMERIKKLRHQRCEFSMCCHNFLATCWSQPPEMYESEPIQCPKCKQYQPKILLKMIAFKLNLESDVALREELLQNFDDLSQIYLGAHYVKQIIAQRILYYFLESHSILTPAEFLKLREIALFNVKWHEDFEAESSIQYTTSLMPLFDLIALGYYKPPKEEMEKMLHLGLVIVSDEFKAIIMNYYNDYIKEKYI